jgi:hypothetical protein
MNISSPLFLPHLFFFSITQENRSIFPDRVFLAINKADTNLMREETLERITKDLELKSLSKYFLFSSSLLLFFLLLLLYALPPCPSFQLPSDLSLRCIPLSLSFRTKLSNISEGGEQQLPLSSKKFKVRGFASLGISPERTFAISSHHGEGTLDLMGTVVEQLDKDRDEEELREQKTGDPLSSSSSSFSSSTISSSSPSSAPFMQQLFGLDFNQLEEEAERGQEKGEGEVEGEEGDFLKKEERVPPVEDKVNYSIAILGRPNVGKSSFLNKVYIYISLSYASLLLFSLLFRFFEKSVRSLVK